MCQPPSPPCRCLPTNITPDRLPATAAGRAKHLRKDALNAVFASQQNSFTKRGSLNANALLLVRIYCSHANPRGCLSHVRATDKRITAR